MKMNLERLLVHALNRRRQEPPEKVTGLFFGCAETLIGRTRKHFCLPTEPTQHTFISGRTGTGKTTFLLQAMAEHFRNRVPFLFIDFHGHATECLVSLLASNEEKRQIVLFEPWSDPVVGWNPLESKGESPYQLVQELVGIFHLRLWPDAWGPRLEELLRMTLLALAETKLTLLEATAFISRPEFRRAVLQNVRSCPRPCSTNFPSSKTRRCGMSSVSSRARSTSTERSQAARVSLRIYRQGVSEGTITSWLRSSSPSSRRQCIAVIGMQPRMPSYSMNSRRCLRSTRSMTTCGVSASSDVRSISRPST